MLEETKNILSTIKDVHLLTLIDSFMRDEKFINDFSSSPAAMIYHQNYIGGLLEHTLNVIKICDQFCILYPELNRDLILAGAFLHDIGKTKELDVSGMMINMTDEGTLIGHTVIGYNLVLNRIMGLEEFPDILKFKILHMVLSHNGKLEYGSPKLPQFPEAVALYHADESDAKVDLFLRQKREANTEETCIYDTKIKGRLYLK